MNKLVLAILAVLAGFLIQGFIVNHHTTNYYGIRPDGSWEYLGQTHGALNNVMITNWKGNP